MMKLVTIVTVPARPRLGRAVRDPVTTSTWTEMAKIAQQTFISILPQPCILPVSPLFKILYGLGANPRQILMTGEMNIYGSMIRAVLQTSKTMDSHTKMLQRGVWTGYQKEKLSED
jgi:hypothetical protein